MDFNAVVMNSFFQEWVAGALFPPDEPLFRLSHTLNMKDPINMWDVLVLAGVFTSKNQARKNWKGPVEIPPGFNQWSVGKHRTLISVWMPIADLTAEE